MAPVPKESAVQAAAKKYLTDTLAFRSFTITHSVDRTSNLQVSTVGRTLLAGDPLGSGTEILHRRVAGRIDAATRQHQPYLEQFGKKPISSIMETDLSAANYYIKKWAPDNSVHLVEGPDHKFTFIAKFKKAAAEKTFQVVKAVHEQMNTAIAMGMKQLEDLGLNTDAE